MGTEDSRSCFLNVDLDLEFEGDIGPLIVGFGSAVTELHRREGFASLELRRTQPENADEGIEGWHRLVTALGRRTRALWDGCRRRSMNVGVDAPASHSVEFPVSRGSIERLHELGADLVLTVYRRKD